MTCFLCCITSSAACNLTMGHILPVHVFICFSYLVDRALHALSCIVSSLIGNSSSHLGAGLFASHGTQDRTQVACSWACSWLLYPPNTCLQHLAFRRHSHTKEYLWHGAIGSVGVCLWMFDAVALMCGMIQIQCWARRCQSILVFYIFTFGVRKKADKEK